MAAKHKARRYRPSLLDERPAAAGQDSQIWVSLESWGFALKKLAETGNPNDLKQAAWLSGISIDEMGSRIVRIARGEDARVIFWQNGARRGRQNEDELNKTRAFVYWEARVKCPDDVKGAIRIAQQHFSYLPPPKSTTVTRIARHWRTACLDLLDIEALDKKGPDTGPLHAYLKRKSKRGKDA